MIELLLASLLAVAGQADAPPTAAARPLTLPQQTSLRCAAAFALVESDRAAGSASHAGYPELRVRGKEFFVRTAARVMDETGSTREQVQQMLQSEVAGLSQPGRLGEVMPACLLLLDASGL